MILALVIVGAVISNLELLLDNRRRSPGSRPCSAR